MGFRVLGVGFRVEGLVSGVAQFNVFGLGFSLYGVFLLVSRAAATARRSEDPDLGLSMDDGAAVDFVAKRKAFSHLGAS